MADNTQDVAEIRKLILQNKVDELDAKLEGMVTSLGEEAVADIINTPALIKDGSGFPTLLGQVANTGNVEMGEVLVHYGAGVNQNMLGEDYKQTPLHAAYAMGHVKFAEFLEDNNADKTAMDFEGKTPAGRIGDERVAASRAMMEKMKAVPGHDLNYKAERALEDLLTNEQTTNTVHVKNIGQGNNVEISSQYSAPIDFIEAAIEKFKTEHQDRLTHVSRKRGGNTIQVTGIAETELRNIFRHAINNERQNRNKSDEISL